MLKDNAPIFESVFIKKYTHDSMYNKYIIINKSNKTKYIYTVDKIVKYVSDEDNIDVNNCYVDGHKVDFFKKIPLNKKLDKKFNTLFLSMYSNKKIITLISNEEITYQDILDYINKKINLVKEFSHFLKLLKVNYLIFLYNVLSIDENISYLYNYLDKCFKFKKSTSTKDIKENNDNKDKLEVYEKKIIEEINNFIRSESQNKNEDELDYNLLEIKSLVDLVKQ